MKNNHQIGKTIVLITQIGITMLTSILLCGALGYYIDKRFDSNFLIFFIILGAAGGYRAVYSLIKQYINFESKEDSNIENLGKKQKDLEENAELENIEDKKEN